MSKLTPIQLASRASKAAAAADKKDPHSEATKDAHGDAHGHWHHLAKSEKDDFYKSHYATMAKHHFDRSYGKDSKMPYRVEGKGNYAFNRIPGGKAARSKPSDFDQQQLAMGTKVELEHGKDKKHAREIAMDHLKEFPDYYTRLKHMEKKAKEESAADIRHLLGLLENVRASFDEASPPPFKAKERQAAGLPAMPTRKGAQPPPIPMKAKKPVDPKSDVGQALGDMKKMGKEAELKKRRAADASAREKKQQDQLSVAKKRIAAGGTHLGTKNLGIKRSFSSYKVPGAKPGARDVDVAAGAKMAGDAARTRASKGESIDLVADIRNILEAVPGRYGGGSPLAPRELAAKGIGVRSRKRKLMPRAR